MTNPANNAEGQRPAVLVVDDQPITRKLMTAWLESAGYTVTQASDGQAAWDAARDACPPIVVTDWNMPTMSGLDLCRSIRGEHEADRVFVLIATARDTSDDLSEAMDAGANDFLSKPINENEFLARIKSAEISLKRLQAKTQLAEMDPLTGLLNRRSFLVRGQRSIDLARQSNTPVAAVSMDIDMFKQFNDVHGHAVGDEVLRIVAEAIVEQSRSSDLVARIGGDEFYVLLSGATEDAAAGFAERVRRQIALISTQRIEGINSVRTTLGVAPLTDGLKTIECLLESADQVLVAAKNEGRDRTLSLSTLRLTESSADGNSVSPMEQLRHISARAIANCSIAVLNGNESLRLAQDAFLDSGVDCACVVNNAGKLVGMVSDRDFLRAWAAGGDGDAPLSSVMSSNFARFSIGASVSEVWGSLQRNPMLRIVIVDEADFPVGFVERRAVLETLRDVVHHDCCPVWEQYDDVGPVQMRPEVPSTDRVG